MASINPNTWGSAQGVIDWMLRRQLRPDALALQETRLKSAASASTARAWAAGRGWKLHFGLADSTGPGPTQSSAGIAVGTSTAIGSASNVAAPLQGFPARLKAITANCIGPGGIDIIGGYFKDGIGLRGLNLDLLEALGLCVASSPRLWIMACDWNFPPEALEASGWLKKVRGVVVAPAVPTCFAGEPSSLDYFVIPQILAPFVDSILTWVDAPCWPHCPSVITFKGLHTQATILRQVAPKPFPPLIPIGCQRPPDTTAMWSWDEGGAIPCLAKAYKETMAAVEGHLCLVHDLIGEEATRKYVGRAEGFKLEQVPLAVSVRKGLPQKLDDKALAWKGLSAMVAKAASMASAAYDKGKGWRALRQIKGRLAGLSKVWHHLGGPILADESSSSLARLFTSRPSTWAGDLRAAIALEAEQQASRCAAENYAGWKSYAEASVLNGGGLAHRFSKGHAFVAPDLETTTEEGTLPVVGGEAIDVLLQQWLPRWQEARRMDSKASRWDTEGQQLPPITLKQLKSILRTYSFRVGLGMDKLHPRALLQLPDHLLLRLLDLLHEWERQPLPLEEFLSLIVFLGKPEGGVRPIGLTICLLRIWSRARSQICRQWEADNDEAFFWGKATQSCERAGWVHNVVAAYATRKGLAAASLMADLEKFYEHVSHEDLLEEAKATGFNLVLLRALCVLYSGSRAISYQGACSQPFEVGGTILAGCSCATTLAKLLLLRLLRKVDRAYPLVHITNVVDDVAAQACGTQAQVATQLAGATEDLLEGFSRLHLPVSIKKTAFMANSQELGKDLCDRWSLKMAAHRRSIRHLGTDATVSRRRVVKTSLVRRSIAKGKALRLQQISATGANAHLVFRSGVTAAVVWGSTVAGMPPAELHRWRTQAIRMFGRLGKGLNVVLKLRASRAGRKYDPGPIHHALVLQQYALAVWVGYPSLGMLGDCLQASILKLSQAKHPWQQVVDPIDSVVMTLSQLGWKPLAPALLRDDLGREWDLYKASPGLIGTLADQSPQRQADRAALARHKVRWAGPIGWEALGSRLDRCTGDWTRHHQHSLRSIIANAHWCQQRLFDHCRATSNVCLLCQGSPGTLWHRRFGCPQGEARRRQHVSDRVMRFAKQALETGAEAGELFARAIFPDPTPLFPRLAIPQGEEIHWVNRPACWHLTGTLFTDGSGRFPCLAALRRAGWAIVQVDVWGNLVAAAYGPVPFQAGPLQEARDGEDYAIHMLPKVAMAPFHLFVDCAATVACLEGGQAYSTKHGNPRAGLWGPFWASFGPGDFQTSKTLAHATAADVDRGLTTHWERKANGEADRLAKIGAFVHRLPADALWTMRGLHLIASEVATWAGRQEVAFAQSEVFDSTGIGGTEHLQFMESDEEFFADKPPLPLGNEPTEAEGSCEGNGLDDAITAHGHTISMAPIATGGEGKVFACLTCGAYAWKNWKGLVAPCGGPNAEGLKDQRSRIGRGLFPHSVRKGWKLGTFSKPEGEDLALLASKVTIDPTKRPPRPRLFPEPIPIDPAAVLAGYGLSHDDLPDLRAWAKLVFRSKALPLEEPEWDLEVPQLDF